MAEDELETKKTSSSKYAINLMIAEENFNYNQII